MKRRRKQMKYKTAEGFELIDVNTAFAAMRQEVESGIYVPQILAQTTDPEIHIVSIHTDLPEAIPGAIDEARVQYHEHLGYYPARALWSSVAMMQGYRGRDDTPTPADVPDFAYEALSMLFVSRSGREWVAIAPFREHDGAIEWVVDDSRWWSDRLSPKHRMMTNGVYEAMTAFVKEG